MHVEIVWSSVVNSVSSYTEVSPQKEVLIMPSGWVQVSYLDGVFVNYPPHMISQIIVRQDNTQGDRGEDV